GDLEEERRIMYVAATRAEDHLVVSYVREMALRTGVRSVDRSEFLDVFPGGEEEQEIDLETATEEEIEAAAQKAEDEILAKHPGLDTESDEYLSLLAGQPIVNGMTASENASVEEYDASGLAARDAKAWAEEDPEGIRELIAKDLFPSTGRNPGSVRPGVAAIFGDAKCLCGESLLGHGEECASAERAG